MLSLSRPASVLVFLTLGTWIACSSSQSEGEVESTVVPAASESPSRVAPSTEKPKQTRSSQSDRATFSPTPSGRTLTHDLVREAARAQLWIEGLYIDAGTVDFHKYSRGGFQTGWSRNALDAANSVSTIEDSRALLDVHLLERTQEVVIRAKGKGTLSLSADGKAVGRAKLGGDYQLLRFRAPMKAGSHRLTLRGKGASIDWLWLAEEAGNPLPSTERTRKDVLLAPTPRRFVFSLRLKPESSFDFQVEGGKGARFGASIESDNDHAILFDYPAGPGRKVRIQNSNLGMFGDDLVELWLETEGENVEVRAPRISIPARKAAARSPKRPKNLIVLLIDTQRADSFSPVGMKQALPAAGYESLVKGGTRFSRAFNAENWTKPSIASTVSSLYPMSHGCRWRVDRCSGDMELLSEHLQEAGFATASLVSNRSAGAKYGFNQGFDLFEKTDNAQQAFGRALDWLDGHTGNKDEKPFYLYIQTIDPHVPFSVPETSAESLYGGPYAGKLGPSFDQSEEDALNAGELKLSNEDARWLRALYDAEVLYHDKYFASFLAGFRRRGLDKDTAIVVLNDHGEEFGELGRWGHGWTMGEALFRSPLLLSFPGYFPDKQIDEAVEHIDLAPTLVDALGLAPMPNAQGQSLLPTLFGEARSFLRRPMAVLHGRPRIRGLRVDEFKLLWQGAGAPKLYKIDEPGGELQALGNWPIAARVMSHWLGEALGNPKKSERYADRSALPSIRPERAHP